MYDSVITAYDSGNYRVVNSQLVLIYLLSNSLEVRGVLYKQNMLLRKNSFIPV